MRNLKGLFLLFLIVAGCTAPAIQSEGPATGQVVDKAPAEIKYEELNQSLKELVEKQVKDREERKTVEPAKRDEERSLQLVPR